MTTLLVLSNDNSDTGGLAAGAQKSRSPVTFRSSGFDQATISVDAIAVNFYPSPSPGSGRRGCPRYSRQSERPARWRTARS